MSRYVALLRGVNVGGVQVKMAELKKAFETAGFSDVTTILASGNVVLKSKKKNTSEICTIIEAFLKKKWKRDISVVVHTIDEIKKLDASQPFKGINVTPQTRLYVTFLFAKPKSHIKLPSSKFFRIVKISDMAVCTAMVLAPDQGHTSSRAREARDPASAPSASGLATGPHPRLTLDLMDALGKHYGKNITTRNWNTVQKILKVV